MLRDEVTHADATFAVHRDEATDRVLIGAVIDDVFVPFYETKLSLFDHFHRQGLEQKAAQQQQAEQQQQQQQ